MAKWFGQIGFSLVMETEPGIWEEQIIEKPYYGELLKCNRRWDSSGGINDNINFSNQISILSDPFASNNMGYIRYVTFNGTKWKVNSVDVEYPRLKFTLGGIYNEERSE